LPRKPTQVVVSADPFAADEGLGRRLHAVLGLEGVGLLARGEVMILDLITRALQQVLSLEAVRAGVLRHHHAVKHRLSRPLG
jgi:hypothetical protein